jgi:hypothetical protein
MGKKAYSFCKVFSDEKHALMDHHNLEARSEEVQQFDHGWHEERVAYLKKHILLEYDPSLGGIIEDKEECGLCKNCEYWLPEGGCGPEYPNIRPYGRCRRYPPTVHVEVRSVNDRVHSEVRYLHPRTNDNDTCGEIEAKKG